MNAGYAWASRIVATNQKSSCIDESDFDFDRDANQFQFP